MTHEDIGKAFDSKTVTPRIIVYPRSAEDAGGTQWSGAEYTRAGLYVKGDDVQLTIEHTTFEHRELRF